MSRAIDNCVENIAEAFVGNICADSDSNYYSLDNLGKAELKAALTQLVFEIKEEIRNEST